MLKNIYGIYDRKAKYYCHLYFSPELPESEAANFIRTLKYSRKAGLSDEKVSMIVLYPEDFELHILGNIDESTGSIFSDESIIALGSDAVEITDNEGD